jgi:hypothetical protein
MCIADGDVTAPTSLSCQGSFRGLQQSEYAEDSMTLLMLLTNFAA